MSASIDAAVLLAAGEGSRLRAVAPSKPLCPVAGKPLIEHALGRLARAGLARAIVVAGYLGEEVERFIAGRTWPLAVEVIRLADWTAPNGVSALAGLRAAGGSALLAMCDHLVDPALYALLASEGAGSTLTLGVDRRLGSDIVDLDDVTRVATRGDRITAIGKGLPIYDAFDTGVFAVNGRFADTLSVLQAPSITEGVRLLAGKGEARALDVGSLGWIDVDDAKALDQAERWLSAERTRRAA